MEEIEFTPLQDELLTLLNANDIHEDLWDVCLEAFSTDDAIQSAIKWLRQNPNFKNKEVSRLISKFGIESEDFSLTTEIVDDEE